MRIAHISDIHIRGLSRHTEYYDVLGEFIKDVQRQKCDHIFVGGDIFHTKTMGISPEYIDFLRWWLTEMAKVCPVHLTLGNHDGNLSNASRQDAVTPIVETMNNPRVFLYKKSGVYSFAPGFNWCVFSLFDEDNWDKVKPVPGDINIACYHGPVMGAKSETDWDIEDGLQVEFFKDYDFCLLGDIHRLQYLDFRDVELVINEDDLHLYPGAEILEVIDD